MTVKSIPYWQQRPAWGEPGHGPTALPENPMGRWGWWNDPSITDEDIWRSSPENRAGQELLQRLDQINMPRMAGMFMPGELTVDGFKTPFWMQEKKPQVDPRDYLM